MAKTLYLLDMDVLAELTRPAGNRRIVTLFAQRQSACAFSAPMLSAFMTGLESLADNARKAALMQLARELLRSGLPVLSFDREAALWLAHEGARRRERRWTALQGQQAAIAATTEHVLVTRAMAEYSGTPSLRVEDWFRP